MSLACGITKYLDYVFNVNIYDVRIKKSEYSYPKDEPIQDILDELITEYGNDIRKIVIGNDVLKSDELEDFKENNLKKYGDLVHVATKEELDFEYYLQFKVEYSVGDLIIQFEQENYCTLYECREVADGRVTWKELDKREHQSNKIDFEYVERMFKLKMNQVHAVFKDTQEEINSIYGSKFSKYRFKSINFIKKVDYWRDNKALLLARNLISDPDAPVIPKFISYYE